MPAENPLGITEFGYIAIECFHIGGFVLAIGATALLDLRLLGLILPKQNPEDLNAVTQWSTAAGLLIAIATGFMLYSVDPDSYYTNSSFLIKMATLILAIALNYTIHRKAVKPEGRPRQRKIAASLSLVLWLFTICCGIFIANNILDFG